MKGLVDWIGAQAEGDEAKDAVSLQAQLAPAEKRSGGKSLPEVVRWQELPAHNFPGRLVAPTEEQFQDDPLDRNPDLWMYRKRTVGLLRRYLRFSLETGRLPSFIGNEFFRAQVSHYTATTFEDRVILVRDVEKSLDRLEYWDQQLVVRIILQEHSQEKTARILQCGLRTIERRLPMVLDLLSEDFLRVGLLVAGQTK
jgi:hypothetical protein